MGNTDDTGEPKSTGSDVVRVPGRTPRSDCAVATTLDVIGDRWSLLIIRDLLFGGELRYGELLDSPEGIASNTLADRLRRLEQAGLVARELYRERPPRACYRLTNGGAALAGVLRALSDWGTAHFPGTRSLADEPDE